MDKLTIEELREVARIRLSLVAQAQERLSKARLALMEAQELSGLAQAALDQKRREMIRRGIPIPAEFTDDTPSG